MSDTPHDVAIRVSRLGKSYPVYASPLDALKEIIPGRKHHTEFPALHDVSFDLRRGERVGIVGSNGAGKSTLLKVLSGTVDHTAGSYEVHGELRAILELGTGFHEECTGRENILMGGLCLGYSTRELAARTDWIIAFSELGRVIDRPLRTYSSGMKARLMYSVAFCMPVGIMIIDEALATGDGAFVRKCTNHIVELCSGGTTALIVSHNLYFLERICHRVIYLKEGRVVADGDPLEVCKLYEADLGREFVEANQALPAESFRRDDGAASNGMSGNAASGNAVSSDAAAHDAASHDGLARTDVAEPIVAAVGAAPFVETRPLQPGMLDPELAPPPPGQSDTNGPGEIVGPDGALQPFDFTGAPAVRHLGLVKLREARLFDEHGRPTTQITCGRPCRMRFVVESRVRKRDVHLGFMIWNDRNEHVATTTNVCSLDGLGRPNGVRLDLDVGVYSVDVVFPSLHLGAAGYYCKFGVSPGREHYSDDDLLVSENRCLAFAVVRPDHVQTVYYEPHSVWSPLQRVGALPTTSPAAPACAPSPRADDDTASSRTAPPRADGTAAPPTTSPPSREQAEPHPAAAES